MSANNFITNLSKDKYTIKAQSTMTISFMGASPNYYRITNGGATPLYLGVSMMPTEDFFDMKIPSATTKLYVDAYGHDEIYLYNPSIADANIIITSFNADFEPSVLALSDVGQDFSNIEFTGEVDATGDLKNILNRVDTNVNFNKEATLQMVSETAKLNNTVKNICAVYSKEMNVSSSSAFTSYCDDNRIVTCIDFLSNDGENDIVLGICNILDNPDEYWTNITVKSGESINNLVTYASAITMTCNNTTGSKVRLVFREGVK